MNYLYLFLVVFGINLLPAFGPPTWSILVLFRLHSHIDPIAMVLLGAMASSTGRYVLARASGLLRSKVSAKMESNLAAAKEVLNNNTKNHVIGMGLFALSPLPSAQLFEAAGLIGLRLAPITFAFFGGRLVSYTIFVVGAGTLKSNGLGEILTSNLKSPLGIAVELASLALLYLLTRINWVGMLSKRHAN